MCCRGACSPSCHPTLLVGEAYSQRSNSFEDESIYTWVLEGVFECKGNWVQFRTEEILFKSLKGLAGLRKEGQ